MLLQIGVDSKRLQAGSAKICDIAYWYGIDLESISYRNINTSINTA